MSRFYKIGLLAGGIFVFFMVGCKNDSMPVVSDPNKNQLEIEKIRTETGLLLPSDTVVISSEEGDRDISDGYHSWIIFSPSKITMLSGKNTDVEGSHDLLLKHAVRVFEYHLGKKIVNPQIAFFSLWDSAKYSCSGKMLRSSEGDYLYLERFIKK